MYQFGHCMITGNQYKSLIGEQFSNFPFSVYKMWVWTLLLPLLFLFVGNNCLKPCSEEVSQTGLCTNQSNYQNTEPCYPRPCKLNPIIDIRDVLSIDTEENTITYHIYIVLEWIDERIQLAVPEGQQ